MNLIHQILNHYLKNKNGTKSYNEVRWICQVEFDFIVLFILVIGLCSYSTVHIQYKYCGCKNKVLMVYYF